MGKIFNVKKSYLLIIPFFLSISTTIIAQPAKNDGEKYDIYKNWKFGGALGLGFGSGYTDITIAPSAIHEINPYLSLGLGLQGSYVSNKNINGYYSDLQKYDSWIYGGSLIAISNPVPFLQLSAELEQLRVNNSYTYKNVAEKYNDSFWNTALFLGIGYNNGPVTIGVKYNVLYKEKDMIYSSAYLPFVRVYF